MSLQVPRGPARLVASWMGSLATERVLFDRVLQGVYVSGATVFLILLLIPAPFGRFYSKSWGPPLNGKLSWFIFELVSPATLWYFFLLPETVTNPPRPVELRHNAVTWTFVGLWFLHYLHRTVIYPYLAPAMSPASILAVVAAILFNTCNGYMNGRYFAVFGDYTAAHFSKPSFWAGLAIFFAGMYANIRSDHMLFALRRNRSAKAEASSDPKQRYSIPRGFLFDYVSCPAYLGEIVEWIGFAIATGSPAAWCFAAFTFGNLFPRGLSTHRWYKETFGDSYPKDRRAVIPFVI
ncbi:3-oxo-5-alpha-steroid 4-dehydrogenase-domain-containing protein [Hyaloraphidium curvatum]|nr:3-oxo-5-alpha-steroid 4-dehydrogenase-domain-containing protein [Hyaloraphidium curvatum]